jgi:CBS domain-containing protein
MITVAGILTSKKTEVFYVTPDTTVYDAIKLMSEKNIGALPVVENQQLAGIFSERDYARKIVLQNRTSQDTLIGEIMTSAVITITPQDSIEHCMEMMSSKKIRHLPVMENNQMVGIISIGDVVTAIIQSQKDTINYLQTYISQ